MSAGNLNVIGKLSKLFKKCGEENFQLGDEGQTYQQFLAMKNIPPNQEGTGRISFKDVEKVECVIIPSKKSSHSNLKQIQETIKRLIQTFLHIKAEFVDYSLQYQNGTIIDRHKNLQFSLKVNKNRVDALQMLDLLTEYKNKKSILVAFLEQDLHENKSDVYGRACGDGVAVIDFKMIKNSEQNIRLFFETVIHETLHTLGFDHCLKFSCLMNGIVAREMWLCPECMKKILGELQQIGVGARQWVEGLSKLYMGKYFNMKQLTKKSEKITQFISQQLQISSLKKTKKTKKIKKQNRNKN